MEDAAEGPCFEQLGVDGLCVLKGAAWMDSVQSRRRPASLVEPQQRRSRSQSQTHLEWCPSNQEKKKKKKMMMMMMMMMRMGVHG